MKKLWLLFAQFTTLCVAALFVIATFSPELLRPPTAPSAREQVADAAPAPASYRLAAKKAMPAVVNIYTAKHVRPPKHPFADDPLFRRFFGERFDDEPRRVTSLGSGVIVDRAGYILTNHHVIEAAEEIQVLLADGRSAPARLIGSDPETDLAVIRIDLPDLPSIEFGHADRLAVGDVVLAIGNPFGVGQTVTMGIVSALGRSQLGINTFEDFIQTDAPINPGNSGGALVDTNGALVGISSAIFSKSGGSLGIGFAIPETQARQVLQEIIRHGAVVRGWIGASLRDLPLELAHAGNRGKSEGVLVVGVLRDGPADRAGVRPGDILTAIGGEPLPDANAALTFIARLAPGRRVTASLVREGREREVTIVIGRRPPRMASPEEEEP